MNIAILALVLAPVLLLAGVALWLVDARRRRAGAAVDDGGKDVAAAPEGDRPSPEPRPAEGDAERNGDPAVDAHAANVDAHAVDAEDDADAPDAVEEPLDVDLVEEPADPVPPAGVDPGLLRERLTAPPRAEEPREHRGRGFQVPGAARRERRSWAQARGFRFTRGDDYLDDEWARGAAADGGSCRDVVSGVVEDREFHLLDLGPVPVMAVRRRGESEVVVDFRRGASPEGGSEDLHPCGPVAGFVMYASDQGPAARFLDERVYAALEAMPAAVLAVWLEGGWVLAELARGSRAADWDAVFSPLTLIADAAPVLPPRPGAERPLDLSGMPPGREIPPAPPAAADDDAAADGPRLAGEETPAPVRRPEEPRVMPRRAEPSAHGVVGPETPGVDEVAAIGEDAGAPAPDDRGGTRVLRPSTGGPTIFDDLAAELGADPLDDAGATSPEPEPPAEDPPHPDPDPSRS